MNRLSATAPAYLTRRQVTTKPHAQRKRLKSIKSTSYIFFYTSSGKRTLQLKSRVLRPGKKMANTPAVIRAKVLGQAYFVNDIVSAEYKLMKTNHIGGLGLPHNPGVVGALKTMGGIGIVTGTAGVLSSQEAYKTAKKAHYVWGQCQSLMKGARSGAEVLAGANVAANGLFDCLTYHGFISASKSSFAAMRVLGRIASAASSFRYLSFFAYSAYNLVRTLDVRNELSDIEEKHGRHEVGALAEGLELLKSKIEMQTEDYQKVIKDSYKSKEKVTLTSEDLEILTQADLDFVNKRGIKGSLAKKVLKEIALRKKGKEMDLSERIGAKAVKELRVDLLMPSGESIVDKLKEGDNQALKEAQAIMELVKKESKSRVMMGVLLMVFSAVGAATGVIANIFSAGVVQVIMNVISIVLSSSFLYLDGLMVLDGFRSNKKGKYDDIFRFLINIAVFTVSVLAVVYTAGTPLIIMGLATAIVMLSVNFGIWYKNKYGKPLPEPEKPHPKFEMLAQQGMGVLPH